MCRGSKTCVVEKELNEDQGTTHIVFETSNITSGNTNWPTALARNAAVQFVQETRLATEQNKLRSKEAKEVMTSFVGDLPTRSKVKQLRE